MLNNTCSMHQCAAAEQLAVAAAGLPKARSTAVLRRRARRCRWRTQQTAPVPTAQRQRCPGRRTCSPFASVDSSSVSDGPSSAAAGSNSGVAASAAEQLTQNSNDECLEVAGMASLEGHVRISGAKNSALALFAGALLCSKGEMLLRRVPQLLDMTSMSEVLESVGCKCEFGIEGNPENALIRPAELTSTTPSVTAVRKLRASFLVCGPLLARLGEACLPLPGTLTIAAERVIRQQLSLWCWAFRWLQHWCTPCRLAHPRIAGYGS